VNISKQTEKAFQILRDWDSKKYEYDQRSLPRSLTFVIASLLLMLPLSATESLYFQSHDWLTVCDNTRTCRISGYSSFDANLGSVSVLFTQKSVPDVALKAKVRISFLEDEEYPDDKLTHFPLEMLINNKSHGYVSIKKETMIASLSTMQTQALLTSLKKNVTILWKTKKNHWQLSDRGAAAVLLKVDEYQQRIGTRGALIAKGLNSERTVLKPKLIPTIYAAKISDYKGEVVDTEDKKQLEKVLTLELLLDKEACFEPKEEIRKFSFQPLSAHKLLVSKLCWMGAYNESSYFWVIDNKPPYNPKLITTNGKDFYINEKQVGIISSDHKGRGRGDCWSYENFVWTGERFTLSSKGTTGLCRDVAAGGAWDLPVFTSKIRIK